MGRAPLLALAALLTVAPAGAASAAGELDALGASCRPDHGLVRCDGFVRSFDGTQLDTTLTLPRREPPRGGRPLVVFLHGLLVDKGEYLSQTSAGTGPDRGADANKTVNWNNRFFARRGYAVLNYSARGHGESGGSIELASRNHEVRDSRHLVGLLADADWPRIATRRVAVIGSSYGGGQAWLLLTTREDGDDLPYGSWRSPGGRRVSLAAVVPGYTWTDLLQALLPSGHEGSRTVANPEGTHEPIGVLKATTVNGFVASVNAKLPDYTHRWVVRANQGEPYDPGGDPVLAEARHGLTVERSAYFQHGYFDALAADTARIRRARRSARARRGRAPRPRRRQPRVPVFAAQGWTDPIFSPLQAVQMYRRLRRVSPGYPVGLYLGDFEHLTAQVKIPDLAEMHARGTALLDWTLRGRGPKPRFHVSAAVTQCDPEAFGPILDARTWGSLATGSTTLELAGPKLLTSSAVDERGPGTDPVVVSQTRGRGCVTTTERPSAATWTVAVEQPLTLAGMPRMEIRMRTTGTDATLLSRLWDVAPDGTATLVSRGALRLAPPPPPGRPVTHEMFGNAWRFEPGHRLQLELTQTDSTFFRPDNLPSSITVESVRLELPRRP